MDCIGLGQNREMGKVGGNITWAVPGVNGMILLKLIFRKWDVGVWTASGWDRIGKWGNLRKETIEQSQA